MKATIPIDKFQKKLSIVMHAVSSRAQLPILLNVLLQVKEDFLIIKSTDLEIGIELKIKISNGENGLVSVPAKTLQEVVSVLSGDFVDLETVDGSLSIQTKKSKSKIQTTPADEFPELYGEKGEEMLTLDLLKGKKDVFSVIFSTSTDTTRANLSGLLFLKNEEGVFFVATDGYRLSLKKTDSIISSNDDQFSLLVPARLFREFAGMEGDGGVKVFTDSNRNQIIFENQDTIIVGRLIDASYPDYQRIIPKDTYSTIFFDREETLKAVKMASIFAREGANIVKLSLKKNSLAVSSQAASIGDNIGEVEAVLDGEENEIAFNARYLIDALSNIDSEDIVFEMTGPLNPGVFKIKGDSSYLHLIMPIRVQG